MMSAEKAALPRTSDKGARRYRPLRTFLIFLTVALAAAMACYAFRGEQAVRESLADAWSQLLSLLVELVLGLVIASAVGILVPKDKVARWLGKESGFIGLTIAGALGMITPGGPYASFPLVLSLSKAGADTGALIAFLTAWAASSASRLVIWEIPMLGFDFAVLRFVISIPLPIIAGVIARAVMERYSPESDR